MTLITEPGIYDLPEHVYHSDPTPDGSMSSSLARSILRPAGPARVVWEKDHPVHKDAYGLGSVAHKLVLGKGADIVEVEAADWKSGEARQVRDAARAEHKIPILSKDLLAAKRMASKVMEHPQVRRLNLFRDGEGVAEQSFFWEDEQTGITRRAMLDWVGAAVAVDLKTSRSADVEYFSKAIYQFGYDQQQAWYESALRFFDRVQPFIFVVVEVEPPHFVQVFELDDAFVERGERRNRAAIDRWVQCRESGRWPAYSDGVVTVSPPRWAKYEETE